MEGCARCFFPFFLLYFVLKELPYLKHVLPMGRRGISESAKLKMFLNAALLILDQTWKMHSFSQCTQRPGIFNPLPALETYQVHHRFCNESMWHHNILLESRLFPLSHEEQHFQNVSGSLEHYNTGFGGGGGGGGAVKLFRFSFWSLCPFGQKKFWEG